MLALILRGFQVVRDWIRNMNGGLFGLIMLVNWFTREFLFPGAGKVQFIVSTVTALYISILHGKMRARRGMTFDIVIPAPPWETIPESEIEPGKGQN